MFVVYRHIKFHTSSFSDWLVTTMKGKVKKKSNFARF